MKKCASWHKNLATLSQPLLAAHQEEQHDESNDSYSQLASPSHGAMPIVRKSYDELTQLASTSPVASHREQPLENVELSDQDILHRLAQKSCTTYTGAQDYALFVHACVTRCEPRDFEHIPEHQKKKLQWNEKLHARYSSTPGKVDIESKTTVNYETFTHRGPIYTNFNITTIALHPSGTLIAIAGYNFAKNMVLIYRLDHGCAYEKIKSLVSTDRIKLLAFSPSGNRMLLGRSTFSENNGTRNYAHVFSLPTETVITELEDFNEYTHVTDFACGWLDEYRIIGIAHDNQTCCWPIPPSEPATK